MDSEALKAAEVSLKNSNHREGLINEANEEINEIPTVSAYIKKVLLDNGTNAEFIRTMDGDPVNKNNVFEMINTGLDKQSMHIMSDSISRKL